MIKFLILIALVYLAYRLFIGPPLLDQGKKRREIRDQEPEDDEFADYEEID
ncbi:MAG: hypothetical protein R3301_08090 [Saprospiraceae bacterium]|nr:hypothetical protein [Saprospiraceae bacterium]